MESNTHRPKNQILRSDYVYSERKLSSIVFSKMWLRMKGASSVWIVCLRLEKKFRHTKGKKQLQKGWNPLYFHGTEPTFDLLVLSQDFVCDDNPMRDETGSRTQLTRHILQLGVFLLIVILACMQWEMVPWIKFYCLKLTKHRYYNITLYEFVLYFSGLQWLQKLQKIKKWQAKSNPLTLWLSTCLALPVKL